MAGGAEIASETGVGMGLLRPSAVRPALRWNLDRRFTTCGVACVRIPTGPPYGVMGNTWVVPLSVLTATQRLSSEKAMSCTCDRKKKNAGNEARSCNHCYRGKAISITYSECVSVSSNQSSFAVL